MKTKTIRELFGFMFVLCAATTVSLFGANWQHQTMGSSLAGTIDFTATQSSASQVFDATISIEHDGVWVATVCFYWENGSCNASVYVNEAVINVTDVVANFGATSATTGYGDFSVNLPFFALIRVEGTTSLELHLQEGLYAYEDFDPGVFNGPWDDRSCVICFN